MKIVFLILLFPITTFSQNNFCADVEAISYAFVNDEYQKSIDLMFDLKNQYFESNNYKNEIDLYTAISLFELHKTSEAKRIFDSLINSNIKEINRRNGCSSFFETGESEIENILEPTNIKTIHVFCLQYLSKIAEQNEDYLTALNYWEQSSYLNRELNKLYTCGNAAYGDIIRFEYRKFILFSKLELTKQANDIVFDILLLVDQEEMAKKMIVSLFKEYNKEDLINELNLNTNSIEKNKLEVNGISLEVNTIRVFDKNLITWNFDNEPEKSSKQVFKRIGYKLLMSR